MRFLFDEDFNQRVVRGLVRRIPDLDWRCAHEPELSGRSDDDVLEVAAAESRLLVSHDVNTMTAAFAVRVEAGRPVPGVLLVPQRLSVGQVIEELHLLCEATDADDWAGRIDFLPL